jgi:hypothetical protein
VDNSRGRRLLLRCPTAGPGRTKSIRIGLKLLQLNIQWKRSHRGVEIKINGFSMALQMISGFVVATFIIAAWPAHAEEPFCMGIPFISTDNLTEGHIFSKATRVHFVKDGPGCADQTPACADKAYLVPGDRLIVSKRHDAFICAIYLNTKRTPHIGWLPADAVAYDMAKPIALTDWLGRWSWKWHFGEADLDIGLEAGKPGTLG